jgi:hypothetical protein
VLCPRATHCAANKKKNFSLPLFGVYLIFFFFLSFSIILESLKKNKRMLCYKGGTSVANILVLGARTRLMFRARTFGKIPPGAKGVKTQRQSATGLAYKACFRWFS